MASALLLPATAAASESPLDFAKGPAQWLMTEEEKRAWRSVTSDAQAQELIDLFWVRRDPTPGTFANEFREEFRQRVEFADRRFREGNRRGALTERGRVLVVLGFPRDLDEEGEKRTGQFTTSLGGDNPNDPTGGRALAARDVWTYSHEESIRFGLPKIEVVFIHGGVGGRVRRDTHRNDFIGALPAAIRYYIKNPDLTEVPQWARREIERVPMPSAGDHASRTPPTASADETPASDSAPATASAPAVSEARLRRKGAGRLTFVHDAFGIQPESGTDPFVGLVSVTDFRRDDELGWLFEYCTGDGGRSLPSLEVGLKITGIVAGERVNFTAPPEEMVPDSIKASPGCHLVRGGVPLSEMDPGTYTLTVSVETYNLTKEFRVLE